MIIAVHPSRAVPGTRIEIDGRTLVVTGTTGAVNAYDRRGNPSSVFVTTRTNPAQALA